MIHSKFNIKANGRNRLCLDLCLITFALIVFSYCALQAVPYLCGDANGDQEINIGDGVHIINYIFKEGQAPDPLEAADYNGDDAINVADAVYCINYIFKSGPPPLCSVSGQLVGHTGCHIFEGSDKTPPNLSCIEYQYDGEGLLQITHVNAGFNCCPDTIMADISITGGNITIVEGESLEPSGGCDCLCLFDLYIEITGLPPGDYIISVSEVYTYPEDPVLESTISLTSSPSSGSFCVTRTNYPWGVYPSGSLIDYSGCKNMERGTATDSIPFDQDCIEYEYDGQSFLYLTHVNAGFNCCPVIHGDITIEDNLITIVESETFDYGPCYCLCLFDVNYIISGLGPGEYTIRVIGLYVQQEEYLEFTVNLTTEPSSGLHCVFRDYYPWGVY